MSALELKIPPPIVAAIAALATWLLSRTGDPYRGDVSWRHAAALGLVVIAFAFMLPAMAAFATARTTINPVKPGDASTLITSGIFQITRNPMYVSLATLLLGWATYLAVPFAYIGPVAFVLYVTRFQIAPEERALSAKFGPAYDAYKRRVRRWL